VRAAMIHLLEVAIFVAALAMCFTVDDDDDDDDFDSALCVFFFPFFFFVEADGVALPASEAGCLLLSNCVVATGANIVQLGGGLT
jgi:hypothetical protein